MIKRLALALLVVAAAANAQMTLRLPSPAMVTGTVSAVSGNIIYIANGNVAIDAASAKIVDNAGNTVAVASLTTGSLIVATVKSDNVAANAPIPAISIAVSKAAAVTLTGPVTAVDTTHGFLTLLGKSIQVTAQTSFGGPMHGTNVIGLADIQPNELVTVQANPSGAQGLVAVSVMVMAMTIDHPEIIHGAVKSIATDAWVITGRNAKDVTVTVNAQTQIVGSPKVGDTVDVLTRRDSSNNLVAISIVKSLPMPMPHR